MPIMLCAYLLVEGRYLIFLFYSIISYLPLLTIIVKFTQDEPKYRKRQAEISAVFPLVFSRSRVTKFQVC